MISTLIPALPKVSWIDWAISVKGLLFDESSFPTTFSGEFKHF